MHAIYSSMIAAFYMIVCDLSFDYGLWVFLQYELIVQFFSCNNKNKYLRQTKNKIISAINSTII